MTQYNEEDEIGIMEVKPGTAMHDAVMELIARMPPHRVPEDVLPRTLNRLIARWSLVPALPEGNEATSWEGRYGPWLIRLGKFAGHGPFPPFARVEVAYGSVLSQPNPYRSGSYFHRFPGGCGDASWQYTVPGRPDIGGQALKGYAIEGEKWRTPLHADGSYDGFVQVDDIIEYLISFEHQIRTGYGVLRVDSDPAPGVWTEGWR